MAFSLKKDSESPPLTSKARNTPCIPAERPFCCIADYFRHQSTAFYHAASCIPGKSHPRQVPDQSALHTASVKTSMAKIIVLALSFLLLMAVVNAQSNPVVTQVLEWMDTSVNPCVDFYNYSCGGWLKTHEIPPDRSQIGAIYTLADENNVVRLDIAKDPNNGLVNQYFVSCMDTDSIDALGAQPVLDLWKKLSSASDASQAFSENVALLMTHGLGGMFELTTEVDSLEPEKMIYALSQSGLSLPTPSFYSDSNIYSAFVNHIGNMFDLAGVPRKDAQDVAIFETAISRITAPRTNSLNPFLYFNRKSWSEVQELAPHLHFGALQSLLNLNFGVFVTLDSPSFFSNLSKLVSTTHPDILKTYFKWRILNSVATRLSAPFQQENFNFYGKIIAGIKTQRKRPDVCAADVDTVVPELMGRLYVERKFPPQSKQYIEEMMNSIISSFEVNVLKLTWMDSVTAQRAIEKLQLIQAMVGYPKNPRNYTTFDFSGGYFKNSIFAAKDQFSRAMAKAGKNTVRDEWMYSADTANAYYNSPTNTIAMIAGILQPPFFAPDYPVAITHGAAGMVAGHELTHSLDPEGRNYNGHGKLEDWWMPQTAAAYQKRVDCVIRQYSKFSPFPGYYVNGNLTQGENIADSGGLKTAHAAFMNTNFEIAHKPSVVPGLTNEQLLFVGFGQSFCTKFTLEAAKQRLLTDSHAPTRFRVNGGCINTPSCGAAFKCPVGSPMNPPDRCEVW